MGQASWAPALPLALWVAFSKSLSFSGLYFFFFFFSEKYKDETS